MSDVPPTDEDSRSFTFPGDHTDTVPSLHLLALTGTTYETIRPQLRDTDTLAFWPMVVNGVDVVAVGMNEKAFPLDRENVTRLAYLLGLTDDAPNQFVVAIDRDPANPDFLSVEHGLGWVELRLYQERMYTGVRVIIPADRCDEVREALTALTTLLPQPVST
ncbi:hypothetical protein ACFXJ8_00060 [Nonomuraea sp. NPDC059194]|uniref:hypothetical protein n=1 Tax=Nonomuraea sp. NPDC059194 TaxID=3346764 RepID=UPI003684E4EB